ncbi:ASTL [Branchiostoma lanceolatum]|uniref:Metalloendopeptidase n=1 Tax=Branchiostoma lanceolatum TaxID=7740 RepID=A0A8J9ZNZ0_BRALA|nr:ASTL [Branchiostoma lanceolatum]
MRTSTVSAVLLVFGVGLAASVPVDSLRRSPKRKSVTKTILEANKGLHLYSGDITNVHRNSRNAIDDGWRWPNGVIPYVIGSEFSTSCYDTDNDCGRWASQGECDKDPYWMLDNCPHSCNYCSRSGSSSRAQKPAPRAYSANCYTDSTQMNGDSFTVNCPSGCASNGADAWGTDVYTDDSGICTAAIHAGKLTNSGGSVTVYRWPGQSSYQGSTQNGIQTQDYDAWGSSFAFEAEPVCEDEHASCSHWADIGECQANPNYMLNHCQLSCGVCQGGGDIDGAVLLTAPAGSEVGRIEAAIQEFNQQTCIRFVPRTNQRDYVHIKRLSGCWSDIGVSGGVQELSLGSGCLWKGTIIHELMHAVGFWHEHQRPDRDDYVTIRLQNVEQDEQYNFDKQTDTRTQGMSYDYGSVMHYESDAFSANGRDTIIPKLPLNGIVLGDANELSSLDIQKINKLYDCNE